MWSEAPKLRSLLSLFLSTFSFVLNRLLPRVLVIKNKLPHTRLCHLPCSVSHSAALRNASIQKRAVLLTYGGGCFLAFIMLSHSHHWGKTVSLHIGKHAAWSSFHPSSFCLFLSHLSPSGRVSNGVTGDPSPRTEAHYWSKPLQEPPTDPEL